MGNKKIGIVTILKVDNYGAELQAFATQEVMNLMGYDAEIIDYIFYKNSLHKKEKWSAPFYPYPLQDRIKEWAICLKSMASGFFLSSEEKERKRNFELFHKTFTRLSSKQYRSYSELYNNPPIYDVYCVGSDQVWNPRCYTNLNPYFLTFAPQSARTFSYASSFGVSELPPDSKASYKNGLNNLTNISVRENDGITLVNELTGRTASNVADPTLLLNGNDWAKVEKAVPGITEGYILVYELHPLSKIMDLARDIARTKGLYIVRICKNKYDRIHDKMVRNIVNAGPSEFIYLFRHASVIVTNSFHGTAFSINFRKDFYCVLSCKLKNNSRQLNLLSLCGLTDRVVYDTEDNPGIEKLPIDYTYAANKLMSFIDESMNYIRRAIDE